MDMDLFAYDSVISQLDSQRAACAAAGAALSDKQIELLVRAITATDASAAAAGIAKLAGPEGTRPGVMYSLVSGKPFTSAAWDVVVAGLIFMSSPDSQKVQALNEEIKKRNEQLAKSGSTARIPTIGEMADGKVTQAGEKKGSVFSEALAFLDDTGMIDDLLDGLVLSGNFSPGVRLAFGIGKGIYKRIGKSAIVPDQRDVDVRSLPPATH